VEGVLGFAEHLIDRVRQRQALRTAIFPEGLPFDCPGFLNRRNLSTFQ
jgi:hypothetical protein